MAFDTCGHSQLLPCRFLSSQFLLPVPLTEGGLFFSVRDFHEAGVQVTFHWSLIK